MLAASPSTMPQSSAHLRAIWRSGLPPHRSPADSRCPGVTGAEARSAFQRQRRLAIALVEWPVSRYCARGSVSSMPFQIGSARQGRIASTSRLAARGNCSAVTRLQSSRVHARTGSRSGASHRQAQCFPPRRPGLQPALDTDQRLDGQFVWRQPRLDGLAFRPGR